MPDLQPLFELMLSPSTIFYVVLGSALGILVGAIPGLTGAMLIALALPLTFSMSGEHALVLLVSMYVGSVSGGLITATLLNIPGTPASIVTTLDGYPLAKRGESSRALGLGIFASLFGGLVAWVVLVLFSAPLAHLSLYFGPFDFFALVLVALVFIASVGEGTPMSGLFAGLLGVLVAMPGSSPATGSRRWTLGIHELDDGFKLLPVLIGLFAVQQVIVSAATPRNEVANPVSGSKHSIWSAFDCWKKQWVNLLRSSFIGTGIGILPGIGANIGSVLAYSVAKNSSKEGDAFGNGSEEGVVASESANNATVGGALIPLVAMGIPGSVIDAILLGALVIHGLQPGPMLMQQNPLSVYSIMATYFVSNIVVFAIMVFSARWVVKVVRIPQWVLLPTIITFCVIGSYALANRMFDVWVMLGFGVIGLLMRRMRIPLAPFVIGFVLSPIAEKHLSTGLMQTGGSMLPMITSPISIVLLLLATVVLVWSFRRPPKDNQPQETKEG